MRAVLVLLLVAGFANSANVDSTKSPESKRSDWDDDDSMTLASTTNADLPVPNAQEITTPTPASAEEQITEEQQRPRFISLIPSGTHDVNARSQSDQEGHDQIKYRIYPKQLASSLATTTVNTDSEQDDSSSSSSTTPSSSSEEKETSQDSASDEQATTESPRIKHIQLGKIPLTYEIIPLLPPREEKQQLLGREDTKPISFFPPEEMMPENKPKNSQVEKEQQQTPQSTEEDVTTEVITGKPVPDLKELPPMPLVYMVPPRLDVEIPWNQYPQSTTNDYPLNLDLPQTSTINPLLERINDFLQKAKRHSLEMETTTKNDNESSEPTTAEEDKNTEKMETTTTTEQRNAESNVSTEAAITAGEGERENQENLHTTDPLTPVSDIPEDSNGDLNPSSPAPIPEEPSEEIFTTRGPTILFPRPNYAEVQEQEQDYSPESQPLMPYYPQFLPSSSPLPPAPPVEDNGISNIHPPSMDQYYSDYSNINNNINNPGLGVPPQRQFNVPQQPQLNVPPQPQLNIPPQRQLNVNPYYYTNSNPSSSFLQRRMMISSILNNRQAATTTLSPPPSRPIYISPDSYWPTKYFNSRVGSSGGAGRTNYGGYNTNIYTPGYSTPNNNYNTNYNNPFMSPPSPQLPSSSSAGGYNTNYYNYIRPQRRSPYTFPSATTTIPLGAALNSLLSSSSSAQTSSEEPSSSYLPSSPSYYGGGAQAGLGDYSSFGNPYYSPISNNAGSSNINSYYSASAYPSQQAQASSPYVINYRPMIPYRSTYPITTSDLVNELMYAPLYPYEQYKRVQAQQQAGYY